MTTSTQERILKGGAGSIRVGWGPGGEAPGGRGHGLFQQRVSCGCWACTVQSAEVEVGFKG